MLILSTSRTYQNTTIFTKKSFRNVLQNTRLHASVLDKLAQGIFFWKTIVTFVNLLWGIKFKLKNPYRESEYVRLCSFGLHWDQIAGFSLLGQRIRRSPALAKNLLILSTNTRKNSPLSRLPQQMFILFH